MSAQPQLPAQFLEPAGFQWGRFTTADGAHLRWGHLAAPSPRAACVIVGGFAEYIEKYFETIGDLVRMGLSVWMMDWRGQGGSDRPAVDSTRPRRRDFDRDASDLIAFAHEVPGQALPRILVAHSMGCAASLLALGQPSHPFRAGILSAPMLGLHTAPVPLLAARLAASLAVASGFGDAFVPGHGPWTYRTALSPDTSLTSHDALRCMIQQSWFLAQPRLRVDGATYAWLRGSFDVMDRLRRRAVLERVAVPVLVGSPRQEHFVDPAAAEHAATLLPRCMLVAYPAARHELFLEHDDFRRPWLVAIAQFLAQVLAQPQISSPKSP